MLRIGILTSGGDAPGLNAYIAFLRAMLETRFGAEVEIIGFKYGYEGLCLDQYMQLTTETTTGIKRVAGSILGCNKGFFFKPELGNAAVATIKKHQLDALVVAGGDGTRRGLEKTLLPALKNAGLEITLIHASKSIDNNNASVKSIGYYTASQEVMETFDKLNATAKTHRRYFVVEVMGDNSVELMLSAFEGGADIFVANLHQPNLAQDQLLVATGEAIAKRWQRGKTYGSIALMEKTVTNGEVFTQNLQEWLKKENDGLMTPSVRFIDPGHLFRGATPTQRDRELVARFAAETLGAIENGKSGTILYNAGRTQLVPFDKEEALEGVKKRRIRSVWQKLEVLRAAGCTLIGMPDREEIV